MYLFTDFLKGNLKEQEHFMLASCVQNTFLYNNKKKITFNHCSPTKTHDIT